MGLDKMKMWKSTATTDIDNPDNRQILTRKLNDEHTFKTTGH